MRHGFVGLVFTVFAAAGAVTAQAQSIRPEDAPSQELVARGMERSATFRDLKTRIDTSDVVVYIRVSRCPKGLGACLAWASVSGGVRRLVITVDRFGRSPDQLTALLAHELQHANEVASASEITDLASFQQSFESRGWKHSAGLETGEAIRITRMVAAELAGDSALARRPEGE